MTDSIEQATRARVAEFLPRAIEKTLEAYREFSEQHHDNEKSKEFSAHHTACKVAIAHLELLLKLARWADLENSDTEHSKKFHKILEEAQAEITRYEEKTQG